MAPSAAAQGNIDHARDAHLSHPTVNQRGDENYKMVDVKGRFVNTDKVIGHHLANGGGN